MPHLDLQKQKNFPKDISSLLDRIQNICKDLQKIIVEFKIIMEKLKIYLIIKTSLSLEIKFMEMEIKFKHKDLKKNNNKFQMKNYRKISKRIIKIQYRTLDLNQQFLQVNIKVFHIIQYSQMIISIELLMFLKIFPKVQFNLQKAELILRISEILKENISMDSEVFHKIFKEQDWIIIPKISEIFILKT